MTNSKPQLPKPPQHNSNSLDSNLLLNNPLLAIESEFEHFRLDAASFAAIQTMRNQVALDKLEFQVDLDDPNYNLKTLRLLAWFDAKLELYQELMALHLHNTSSKQPE